MPTQTLYLGLQPFSTSQKHLFFGRDTDIHHLTEHAASEKLTVLYSNSGYNYCIQPKDKKAINSK